MVWLPVFGIFNMCIDVDACDYTWGLYRHCETVCTGSWLWEKNLLPHMDGFSVRQSTITNWAIPPVVMNLMKSIVVAVMSLKQKCGASPWSIVDGLKLWNCHKIHSCGIMVVKRKQMFISFEGVIIFLCFRSIPSFQPQNIPVCKGPYLWGLERGGTVPRSIVIEPVVWSCTGVHKWGPRNDELLQSLAVGLMNDTESTHKGVN